jgi:hypothetical protein
MHIQWYYHGVYFLLARKGTCVIMEGVIWDRVTCFAYSVNSGVPLRFH